ncbi:hypothetical protein [Virgibacillus sp. Bac330]|uniref:hypothetical protein n=1 Tax=Virgibacillus sp. Bac330 TaxID=2419841 RepID=UPI0013CE814B|nr:hypothetical protein [Virgibacillus sp. Bac330]
MNRFVEGYKEIRKENPDPKDRWTIFKSTCNTIAKLGTIEDLQELIKYFDGEDVRNG